MFLIDIYDIFIKKSYEKNQSEVRKQMLKLATITAALFIFVVTAFGFYLFTVELYRSKYLLKRLGKESNP